MNKPNVVERIFDQKPDHLNQIKYRQTAVEARQTCTRNQTDLESKPLSTTASVIMERGQL